MHIKLDKTGTVYWITGLAGAGKTSIALALFKALVARNEKAVFLDGDAMREIMGNDLQHNTKDRIKNAYRISRMCCFLADQGVNVVCATMSLYHEVQCWNHNNIDNYFQVYVKVSMEVLLKRDQKSLYSKAMKGDEKNVVGVDLSFEEPINSDLVLENNEETNNFTTFAEKIIEQRLLFKKELG